MVRHVHIVSHGYPPDGADWDKDVERWPWTAGRDEDDSPDGHWVGEATSLMWRWDDTTMQDVLDRIVHLAGGIEVLTVEGREASDAGADNIRTALSLRLADPAWVPSLLQVEIRGEDIYDEWAEEVEAACRGRNVRFVAEERDRFLDW